MHWCNVNAELQNYTLLHRDLFNNLVRGQQIWMEGPTFLLSGVKKFGDKTIDITMCAKFTIVTIIDVKFFAQFTIVTIIYVSFSNL